FLIVDAHVDADAIHRQVRAALHHWLPLPGPDTPLKGTPLTGSSPETTAEAAGDADPVVDHDHGRSHLG
ncbi:MAG TPA: hypothetical protein VMM13_05245, partial [Euzebya sp.]|nr:hypothetical protein [Euzebya sp.]